MQPNLTITDAARTYILKMLSKQPLACGFRLSIKKTGCSGYSYLPTMVEQVNPQDLVIQFPDLTLYIDSAWSDLLQGVHIDFVEDTKTGLRQKKLLFTNPNETDRCGCGESFHVE